MDSISLKKEIKIAATEAVKKAVGSDFSIEFQTIKNELSMLQDLKNTIQFLREDYDRIKSDLKSSDEKIIALTKYNRKFSETVDELTSRLLLLEQHSRENNLEINGIPENKSENLVCVI